MKDLKVIVVGAGIGGLSTALALATDGHQVTVLEGVKEFLEVRINVCLRAPYSASPLRLHNVRGRGLELTPHCCRSEQGFECRPIHRV
jgi:2-polyprenyl-6-methoxyphenol hydroxylase-like FAD-dependent oxidoreductase